MANKNLLIVIHPYYQRGFEGFAKSMFKKGAVIAIGKNEQSYGINLKGSNWLLTKIFGRAAFWYPKLLPTIKLIKAHNIKRVHFVGEPTYLANISLIIAMLICKIRVDYSCRCAQNIGFKIPFPFSLSVSLIKKYNAKIFPVSKVSKLYCENYLKLKTQDILPNGVPDYFYFDDKFRFTDKKTVLFVGSFFERKGFLDFLEVSEELPQFQFVAVGGGIEKKDLNYFIKNFPKVKIMDRVSMQELINYYDEAKLLLVTSKMTYGGDLPGLRRLIKVPWSEQFCRVIIEAYSRGTEVVAYDSGAISSVIRDSEYLVKEGDIKKLTELTKIVMSEEIDLNKLEDYSRGYTWDLVAEKFIALR